MAETLLRYQNIVSAPNGTGYEARACARRTDDGLWQGWIEFVPIARGQRVRTARETTQPNRVDVMYWATGVSAVYLDGALRRALSREPTTPTLRGALSVVDRPVFDPFSVYDEGEPQLRRRLAMLSRSRLVDLAVTYRITVLGRAVLDCLPPATLLELIVLGVSRGRPSRSPLSLTRPMRARGVPASTTQSDR